MKKKRKVRLTRRERQLKKMGVNLELVNHRQTQIIKLMRRCDRITHMKTKQTAKSIISQFRGRGGYLTERQWDLVEVLCKEPVSRKKKKEPVAPGNSVYAISDGDAIKIGKSNNVAKRMSALQTGSPRELSIVAQFPCKSESHAIAVERRLHNHFYKFHLRGEWFEQLIYEELVLMGKGGLDV